MLLNPGEYTHSGTHSDQYLLTEYVDEDEYSLEFDENLYQNPIFDLDSKVY